MDFVTALPRSKGKHDAIMVETDRLTKMVVLIPTHKQLDAPGTAELFRRHIVSCFGLPQVIVSDRDSGFVGTKLSYSSTFHPQTDGQTERVNRSMEQVLRTFCLDRPQAWAEQLCMVEFVLNTAPHVSTGFSPFKLMYGYEPVVPATLHVSEATAQVPAAEDYLQQMAHDLRVTQESMQKAQEQQMRQANRHRRDHVFTVGDMVMLSIENLSICKASGKKVLQKFIGPFAVESVINPVAVKLTLPPQYSKLHLAPCSLSSISTAAHRCHMCGAAEVALEGQCQAHRWLQDRCDGRPWWLTGGTHASCQCRPCSARAVALGRHPHTTIEGVQIPEGMGI
jgi:hypothetical protein